MKTIGHPKLKSLNANFEHAYTHLQSFTCTFLEYLLNTIPYHYKAYLYLLFFPFYWISLNFDRVEKRRYRIKWTLQRLQICLQFHSSIKFRYTYSDT